MEYEEVMNDEKGARAFTALIGSENLHERISIIGMAKHYKRKGIVDSEKRPSRGGRSGATPARARRASSDE